MAHVSTQLAEVEVTDLAGNPHKLGEAWRDKTALLVWVRHFG